MNREINEHFFNFLTHVNELRASLKHVLIHEGFDRPPVRSGWRNHERSTFSTYGRYFGEARGVADLMAKK